MGIDPLSLRFGDRVYNQGFARPGIPGLQGCAIGTSISVASGRVSYVLGLQARRCQWIRVVGGDPLGDVAALRECTWRWPVGDGGAAGFPRQRGYVMFAPRPTAPGGARAPG